ncbi:MAG TPA: hypothetical protein VGV69_08555, partial [Solirubrobacterales bacterium]|nr:hypothetical protein [Solirubrobacterales bacterium]
AHATWAPQGWPLVLVPGDTVHRAGERPPESYALFRLDGLEDDLGLLLKRRGEISGLSFSPDGSRFAFTEETGRGRALWTASRQGGKPRLLFRVRGNPYASWSPSGRELAVNAIPQEKSLRRHVFLVSLDGSKTRSLTNDTIAEGAPAWTSDGRWITYAGEDGSVDKIRRDGSGRRRLFELPGEEIVGLDWSPDGRHLAFTSRPIPPID